MADKNWQRVKFQCSECGHIGWTELDLNTWVMKVKDLVCDDCLPIEEDD